MPRKKPTDKVRYKVGVLDREAGIGYIPEECIVCEPAQRFHICKTYFFHKTTA